MKTQFKAKSEDKPFHVNYAPSKRKTMKWQWYVITLIIISPLIYFSYNLFSDYFFARARGYVDSDHVILQSPSNTHISKVLVNLSDAVKKGQVLAILDSQQIDNELIFLKSEINYLQSLMQKNELPLDENLKQGVQTAKKNFMESEQYFKNMKDLYGKNIVTIMNYQQALNFMMLAQQSYYGVSQQLESYRQDRLNRIELDYGSKIRSLKYQVAELERKKDLNRVLAPHDGIVSVIYKDNGEMLKVGDNILALTTDENMHIRAYIQSKFLKKLREGKSVEIYFPDGKSVNGYIANNHFIVNKVDDPDSFSTEKEDRILLVIKTNEALPEAYQIDKLPVEISIH